MVFALVTGAFSCGGGTFFFSTDGENFKFFTVSGTVSIVQLTIVENGHITVVTIIDSGTSQTLNFCGNVVDRFPVGTFVTVRFGEGAACSNVVQVNGLAVTTNAQ